MYCSVFDGVLFVEGVPPEARSKKKLNVTLSGLGSQLQSLDDVKRKLAADARQAGANAVIGFRYGQKSSWWAFDHVKWFGTGIAAEIPTSVITKLTDNSR